MSSVLGIDTSNYTTSSALWRDGAVRQEKRPLPVKPGELGLRQSDAVFHHVVLLPETLEALSLSGKLDAVGVSDRPRNQEGSYMPCFLVGLGTARAVAKTENVPLHCFSHQQGHIAAALFSAGRLDLLEKRFLAFHVSGGTTEAVLVSPDPERVFGTEIVARSLDLKGGQAVDRVGAMLGLSFPAGKELEALAAGSGRSFRIRPVLRGCDCSLSGIENRCRAMLDAGSPKEEIAAFCLSSVQAALDGMAERLLQSYGQLPLLFAGGVMSNGVIRAALSEKYGALFAAPEYAADNAAGVAVLAAMKGELL